MTHPPVLDAIAHSGLGHLMHQVSWLFATFETLHFMGLSLLMGAMLLVDLRLIGWLRQMPIRYVLPFTRLAILGFAVNLATGIGFFSNNPVSYYENPAFRTKMVLVLLAGLNVAWFELVERRRVADLPDDADTERATKVVAVLSLVLWTLIIAFGRLLPTYEGASSLFE